MTDFDIAIIGLGVMGSSCAHQLGRRGARVVAFDQLTPPHTMGSSHGHTRIIREAYYEHPLYVPLVRRAYELWSDLERETGATLFHQTGGLMVGPETGPLFRGALDSARTHGVDHEILEARALSERFPAYLARKDWLGLLERRAGMLFPERCIESLLTAARRSGAILRFNTRVRGWKRQAGAVEVVLDTGVVSAKQLIVAAGAWLPGLSDAVGVPLPLEIERQLSHWFQPHVNDAQRYAPANCPIALWEMPGGDVFATFPNDGHGVKCGMHHAGASTSPDTVSRIVTQRETAAARELLESVMPGAGGTLLEARVCLYTNTPDRHFIIDWLEPRQILLLSPCSGHGFKFAAAIGELAAQLLVDGKTWLDLGPFALERFG